MTEAETGRTCGIHHGGDLAGAERRFGTPPQGWLDLSTGINPTAYPLPELPSETWTRLPDRDALARLLAAARRCYGVTDPHCLVAAPGSQALIQWLPHLYPPEAGDAVGVVTPTYGEHARSWAALGYEVEPVADLATAGQRHRILVVVNPNNPDGRRVAPEALLAIAERMAARHGLLVVDEAFVDVAPQLSLAPAAGWPGLVVLRSFGKFFGLGGLRLGFALGPAALIATLAEAIGPWAVSGPAVQVGTAALSDDGWIVAARRQLADAAQRLDALLVASGLTVLGGTDLFRLAAHPTAQALFDRLGRRGVLVRDFPEQPTWLRFGIPADGQFVRLAQALADHPAG